MAPGASHRTSRHACFLPLWPPASRRAPRRACQRQWQGYGPISDSSHHSQPQSTPTPSTFGSYLPSQPLGPLCPQKGSQETPQNTRSESVRQTSAAPSSGPPSRVAIFSQARTPKWLQGAFTTSGKSPVFLFALEMGACFHPRDSRQRSPPLSKIPLRESRVPVFPFPEPPKHNSDKEEKRKY